MDRETRTRSAAPARDPAGALRIVPERAGDGVAVDALIDRAFGPGRFAKSAERLREAAPGPRLDLSLCAWSDDGWVGRGGRLTGAVRLWTAHVGEASVVFLGPIAVEPSARSCGLGAELVRRACDRARSAGEGVVTLVGDLAFFGPLGFAQAPPGVAAPPGPVDPARVLWTALKPGALKRLRGPLSVRPRP